jgi:hypothetical protein
MVKIPSGLFRAAIAGATVAILAVSGTGWAATGDPVPDPDAVPAPYPGGSEVLAVLPPAPTSATACQPHAQGDYAHKSSGDVVGHGWWTRGTCPNTQATVYIYLYEYYSDGTWRLKGSNSRSIWPGGGSGNRVTVRRTCENTFVAGWKTHVYVAKGSGDSIQTPGQNLACQVLT